MADTRILSAQNVGKAVRVMKEGKHIDRDVDTDSAGVVSDMFPLGISLGVRSLVYVNQNPQMGAHGFKGARA